MDLFLSAGINLGDGGRGGRPGRSTVGRSLRVPLLNFKVVAEELKRHTFDLRPQQIEAAQNYAKTAGSARFAKLKETEVRNLFCQKILGEVLGYTQVDAEPPYTLAFERTIRRGAVDVALGRFGMADGADEIMAPFELKGPTTLDLDAIMPGRGYSPVQQAWNYAIDVPGCRWVLVSNCIEIRLYGFGRGRDAYEQFDLSKIDDVRELERLWFLLSAKQLLGGATEALLRQSDSAYKDITDELYQDYKTLRERLLAYLTDAADGPKLAMVSGIEIAQKLLDRILFVAFAERTDLLPDKLIERASKARNEWRPEPYWRNFQALFNEIDVGNEGRGIWAYNGGLFAADPVTDAVVVPDSLTEDLAKLANWDYRSDVPVTVLGHIFEQSITDLEKLRAESRGEEPPKVSKRKREGVIYTPDIVTRFLVERTIGVTLAERFNALLSKHGRKAPTNGDPIFGAAETDAERAFWRDYATVLRALRIVDPACGSGAFLVAAFDLLAAEYRRVVEHLATLGEDIDFDPFDEIVTKNLYGVDLNAESVEITRLALWLKTARNKHRLQNLEATIKVGDSLIDDPKFTEHPFDWRKAFAPIFAEGGFDVVIGNPPYVRMELIKPVKPYLEKHYVVADDRTDLYAYFFERGIGLLKEGGRLGFITSSTFFRTGSGEKLRMFLGDHVGIEAVIDFGDQQIFEGVTTYPAIITLRKGKPQDNGTLSFLKIDADLPKDLDASFTTHATPMPRARLGAGSWQLEDDRLARLRDKIVSGRKTLGEVYGAPMRGIVTGLNEAFVIDQATRDQLVKQNRKSTKLLKQFLRGENIKRWRVEPEGLFLINIPKGKIEIDDYPAIRDWLLPFKKKLEKRATKQEWFELQQAQLAFQPNMKTKKIIYPEFSQGPKFTFDDSASLVANKCFFINAGFDLLAYLNSRAAWFWVFGEASPLRGGQWRLELREQYISQFPIPKLQSGDSAHLEAIGKTCTTSASRRYEIQTSVRHRLLTDLAPPERTKLSRKLEDWWTLDFASFRDEIKRVFRSEIPVKERGEWESYLAKNAADVRALDAKIEKAEREIDAIVYRLFDLTPAEITLLEASISGQY
ncbi:MAG: N-6 DNA methylase [Rhizobiales bacterium]|nr:N-6 DNA methylase [Hyphomicrobiales bacterium]